MPKRHFLAYALRARITSAMGGDFVLDTANPAPRNSRFASRADNFAEGAIEQIARVYLRPSVDPSSPPLRETFFVVVANERNFALPLRSGEKKRNWLEEDENPS